MQLQVLIMLYCTLFGSKQQETQISYIEQHPTWRQLKQSNRLELGEELSQQPVGFS